MFRIQVYIKVVLPRGKKTFSFIIKKKIGKHPTKILSLMPFSKRDVGWYLLSGSVVHAFLLTSRAELLQSQRACWAQSENRLCKSHLLHRSERKGLLKHVIRVTTTSLEMWKGMPVNSCAGRGAFLPPCQGRISERQLFAAQFLWFQ